MTLAETRCQSVPAIRLVSLCFHVRRRAAPRLLQYRPNINKTMPRPVQNPCTISGIGTTRLSPSGTTASSKPRRRYQFAFPVMYMASLNKGSVREDGSARVSPCRTESPPLYHIAAERRVMCAVIANCDCRRTEMCIGPAPVGDSGHRNPCAFVVYIIRSNNDRRKG